MSFCLQYIVRLTIFLLVLASSRCFAVDGVWRVQGLNAVATMLPVAAKNPNMRVSLVLSFNPKLSCSAEIEILVMSGEKLGTVKRQQWIQDQMHVSVDEGKHWSGRTAVTEYSNGMATTSLAADDLIQTLKSGRVAHARTLPGTATFVFPLDGAKAAIETARKNCGSKS